MKREVSMYKLNYGDSYMLKSEISSRRAGLNAQLQRLGARNVSAWYVGGFIYVYGEFDGEYGIKDVLAPYESELAMVADKLGSNEDMDLMYHCIGKVREDKSLIRRRVFATVLKPDCAKEYKARHQKLIDERNDIDPDGAETNFTIRCAQGKYIFGYCELVKSFDHEMTEEEKQSTIAWETRQLEIMDWLTDDVDWITGQKHPKMEQLFLQEGF